mgnify:CR=1 FL=1
MHAALNAADTLNSDHVTAIHGSKRSETRVDGSVDGAVRVHIPRSDHDLKTEFQGYKS